MKVSSIQEHYEKNRQRLVKRMSFRAGSPENGEDIVQEAYARALKYRLSYNGDMFDKWFSTILSNCLRDFKNAEMGHSAEMFDEGDAEGTQCPSYPNHVMREVFELIDTKSLVQQEVLNLHFKQDYSAMDISKITDHSYANCHQVIHRFRQELKELYRG